MILVKNHKNNMIPDKRNIKNEWTASILAKRHRTQSSLGGIGRQILDSFRRHPNISRTTSLKKAIFRGYLGSKYIVPGAMCLDRCFLFTFSTLFSAFMVYTRLPSYLGMALHAFGSFENRNKSSNGIHRIDSFQKRNKTRNLLRFV